MKNYEAPEQSGPEWHSASGKVILFGEHAVVYGSRAIAAGLPDVIRARALPNTGKQQLEIPAWKVHLEQGQLSHELRGMQAMFHQILQDLDLTRESFHLQIDARIPPASGLGASASLAVASTRALAHSFGLELSNEQVNDIAFNCECIAHGTPSGLDNTLATYGGLQLFQRVDNRIQLEALTLPEPLPLMILHSGRRGLTRDAVAFVRRGRDARPSHYDDLFEQIDNLCQRAIKALTSRDKVWLGKLMNDNHDLLCQLGVSCPELENIIRSARQVGSLGGKLTGSGQGGAAIACFDLPLEHVQSQLKARGVDCQSIQLHSD